jgi:2-(1,2-epoxy-1,2-dihydrophenyl)acetyl-CoA isomerase
MTITEFERVTLERDGTVAVLRLNHPEVLNATSAAMIDGMQAAVDAIEAAGREVRCVILTGTGRAFCAGANLQDRRPGAQTAMPPAGASLETLYHPLLRRLRGLPCPIVSAVNGAAAGVGMSLAMMGDLIVAARSAYFLQAFRRIGLVPDGGSTWLLPRRIGTARALELSLLGEKLPAETALAWGLVNRVCDDDKLMDEARALALNLANGPTVALKMIRELYWQSPENSFEDQLNMECRSQMAAARTADNKEGVLAFLEKRPARFRGE